MQESWDVSVGPEAVHTKIDVTKRYEIALILKISKSTIEESVKKTV